jgi:Zn-finger nucleic acid-binding protein
MDLPKRICPGCQSGMRAMFAKAVELDFCQFCGGIWFDPEELHAVTGKPETLSGVRLATGSCPDCQKPLQEGSLRGCEVARCGECRGIFVPPSLLERLAGEEVKLLPGPEALSARESIELKCPGCGERIPLSEAMTTTRGLSCRHCYFMVDSSSSALSGANMIDGIAVGQGAELPVGSIGLSQVDQVGFLAGFLKLLF